MTHKLHKFVPPFTLHFNVETAQNPARKHFEKTNTSKIKYSQSQNPGCLKRWEPVRKTLEDLGMSVICEVFYA